MQKTRLIYSKWQSKIKRKTLCSEKPQSKHFSINLFQNCKCQCFTKIRTKNNTISCGNIQKDESYWGCLELGVKQIHLFAAIPISFAISIGQAYNPNYDANLVTYDYKQGIYSRALYKRQKSFCLSPWK